MTTSPVDLQGVSGGKDTKNIPNGEKKSEGKAEGAEGEGGKDREPAPQSGEKKVVRVEKESDMLLGGLKTTYYSDGSYMVETVNRGVTNSISRYNAKGEKDGRQETYDREGNLLEVGVYMDGQLDGVQELYIDGRLRQRMSL